VRLPTRHQLAGTVTAINPGSVMTTLKEKGPLPSW
jgi:hypothetical protein